MPIPNFLTGHPQLCETLGTDPAKGLFFNGFVGPPQLRAITGQYTPLASIRLSAAQLRGNALILLIVRGAGRAPQKRTCATSAPADARRGTGPERARAAGCANRRTGAAGGAGRYSDQAECRSWADEARTLTGTPHTVFQTRHRTHTRMPPCEVPKQATAQRPAPCLPLCGAVRAGVRSLHYIRV